MTGPSRNSSFLKLNGEPAVGHQTQRLRLYFLVPLILVFAGIVLTLIAYTYSHQRADFENGVVRVQASSTQLFDEYIESDSHALEMALKLVLRDDQLRTDLAMRNRNALLSRATPVFEELKKTFGITHFYFTLPDRIILLRVHQPDRAGDLNERETTLAAQRSRAIVHGLELGPLGTFTLRVVSPWYSSDGATLLGYVELGMEIDRVFQRIHTTFGVQLVLAIQKQYLDRTGWEAGERMLGRNPDWNRFPNVVLNAQPTPPLPDTLIDRLSKDQFTSDAPTLGFLLGWTDRRILISPISDAVGRPVAHMLLITDVSQVREYTFRTLAIVVLVTALGSVALVVFFYFLVGRVGRRIDTDEVLLQELATRDGLTGLYNHREFYSILEREIEIAKTASRPLALLMLDIDHFKTVNDKFGHIGGDRVLVSLAGLLNEFVGSAGRVCRYGGEEITIILPNMDKSAALIFAERLRGQIEKTRFMMGGDAITITASIGVAALSEQLATAESLLDASDAALYVAKDRGRNRVVESQL